MALLDEHIDGKYEILEKIREGGMGAIYKVRHRLLDEVRVVKVIRSGIAANPDAGERFLREARVAIRLRHPNIAQLHDFAMSEGVDGADGYAYIIMEMIDGATLQDVLRRHGPPPVPLTLEIARQTLKALGYLHRQKIVHRDVSPDNLMLTRDVDGHPLVKLIDLGIAKAFEEGGGLTTTGIFLGKPRYAAPEQLSGRPLDARSDLYSFGVVLYELLTGRSPITGNDAASLMAGHLFRPPLPFAESDPAGRLPPALREALLKALAKEPDQRYGSAEELAWALTMIQDGFEPPSADDLAAALAPAPEEEDPTLPARTGSTQDRLDHEFWMTGTPLPPLEPRSPASPASITEPAIPTLGGSLLESVQTQRLATTAPETPRAEPTRLLPIGDDDPGKTRRTPAVPPPQADAAATVASQLPALPLRRDAAATRDAVLDDLTLVTSGAPRPPISAPLAGAGTQAARSGLRKTVLAAAALALLLAAGGAWWLLHGKPAPVPAPASPAAPPLAAEPAPARSVEPAAVEVSPAKSTPEFQAAAAAPGKAERVRKVVPEDPVPAAGPAETPAAMQKGDLIRRGLPNVQEPEPVEFPKYSYPAAAHGTGKKARVRVAVLVDENGKVIDATVRESDDPGLGFNEAALEAARKVPYQPATRDDIPGKMWTELIFEFAE